MVLEHKNERLKSLIGSLKKQSIDQNASIWKRIALELERPTRHQRVVNLSRVEKFCNDNDIVIIPGKLLSGGKLTKKLTIITYAYSRKTAEKLGNNSKIMTIEDAIKKFPKGKDLKIIG